MGLTPAINHGRLTASVWFFWLGIIFIRALGDRLKPFNNNGDIDQARQRAWMRLPLNVILALSPGLSLLWFSLFAPDTPSLTRGGIDVCELETGFCMSGPRAVIVWAFLVIIIGLIGLWLIWPSRGQK